MFFNEMAECHFMQLGILVSKFMSYKMLIIH